MALQIDLLRFRYFGRSVYAILPRNFTESAMPYFATSESSFAFEDLDQLVVI